MLIAIGWERVVSLRVDQLFSGEEYTIPSISGARRLLQSSVVFSLLSFFLFTAPLGLLCAFGGWFRFRNIRYFANRGQIANLSQRELQSLRTMTMLSICLSILCLLTHMWLLTQDAYIYWIKSKIEGLLQLSL